MGQRRDSDTDKKKTQSGRCDDVMVQRTMIKRTYIVWNFLWRFLVPSHIPFLELKTIGTERTYLALVGEFP